MNTALGIRLLKRARYAEAEQLLRRAIERLTAKYTAPKDAEPLYYLGVALGAQGRHDEAFNTFYKATWSAPWRAAAYYSIAEIATRRGQLASALNFLDRSLEANALNIRAWNLKAAVLRHLGRGQEAFQVLTSGAHKADPLDVRALAERWLASRSAAAAKELTDTLTAHPATALETAAEYWNAGLWQDGSDVLLEMIQAAPDKARLSPLLYYYLASFAGKMGEPAKAAEYRSLAAKLPPDYVFPFQYEAIDVLREAMQGESARRARTLLPREPAFRLAARRGGPAVGAIGRTRSLVPDCPSKPRHRLFPPAPGAILSKRRSQASRRRHPAGRSIRCISSSSTSSTRQPPSLRKNVWRCWRKTTTSWRDGMTPCRAKSHSRWFWESTTMPSSS